MGEIFKKYKNNIEKCIVEVNKNSKKNLNISSARLTIVNVFISIIFLKLTRPVMVKLPSGIFYIAVFGILIMPFVISILRVKALHKKYTKRIDKNIKSIHESLDGLHDEYKEKLLEKAKQIDTNIKLNSVSAIVAINDDKTLKYELNQHVFQAIENDFEKEVYLDNEEKVRYLNESISIIEKFQNTPQYKEFETISSGNLITQYLPDCDYKETIANLSKSFRAIDNYYNERKKTLLNIKKPLDLGIDGEKYVNDYLKIYEDEIINLSNIRLEVDGNSIENDNILITRKGIFIIEVKNIGTTGSYSILVEKDGRWIKKFSNREPEVINFNATKQNDRHIALLQKFINQKLNRSIQQNNYLKAEGIVVIANENLDIKNESMQNIYRASEIYRYINRFNDVLTYDEMLEIKESILKENLKPKKYPILDYKSEIKNNTKTFNELISRLRKERQNLCNLYEFFNESGYIECYDWLNDCNILSNFKLSKFKNSVRKIYIPDQLLKDLGVTQNERSVNIEKIDVNIKKDKPKYRSLIFVSLLSIVLAGSMSLFYKPGKLYVVYKDEKYGYRDEKDKIRIKPKYDTVFDFNENGIAAVKLNGKWGFIDKLDKKVVNFKYDYVAYCKSGATAVELNGKWGFINSKGKEIIKPKYTDINENSRGLTAVELNGKWGFVNSKGKEIVKPKYDEINTELGKLIGVKLNGKWGAVDSNGNEVIDLKYEQLKWPKFSELPNMLLIKLNGKWGFANSSKDAGSKYEIVTPKFEQVKELSQDFRFDSFADNGSYIEPDETNIHLLKVKLEGKYGLVDKKTLKIVLDPIYEDIGSFRIGLAPVKLNGKWGFIDEKYKISITPQFDEIEASFGTKKAHVVKDGKYYILYRDGRIQEYVSVIR